MVPLWAIPIAVMLFFLAMAISGTNYTALTGGKDIPLLHILYQIAVGCGAMVVLVVCISVVFLLTSELLK